MSLIVMTALATGLALVAPTQAAPTQARAHVPASVLVSAGAPRPYLTGWFGWWASSDQVQRLIDHADGVTGEVSIFWWAFAGADRPMCTYDATDADGDGRTGDCLDSATPWTSPTLTDYRRRLQQAGISVHASFTDLDSARAGELSHFLATDRRRHALARQITQWARAAGVDGVDLDWENFAFSDGSSTWTVTRPRWVAMIRLLSRMLHRHGLVLSATVPAGHSAFHDDGRPVDSTGYWVYDWPSVIGNVDRLRLMTYDYSWSAPGPIGPNDWAHAVVRSAIAQTGTRFADRIQVGDPQYGKDWVRQDPAEPDAYLTVGDCPSTWQPIRDWTALIAEQARTLARSRGVTPAWSVSAREWTFRYTAMTDGRARGGSPPRWRDHRCRARHEVWFADTRSALARSRIVAEEQIRGITVWNLAAVGAHFYARLADYGRAIAPHPTRVRVHAPGRVTAGSRIAVLARATSRGRPVAGARATLMWRAAASDTWQRRRSGTTDARGWVDFSALPSMTGRWQVRVAGSWSRLPGVSAGTALTRVAYAVSLTASDQSITARGSTRIVGAVEPPTARTASLQRQAGSRWVSVHILDVGPRGLAHWRVSPDRSTTYRMVVPGDARHAQGTAPRLRITVAR